MSAILVSRLRSCLSGPPDLADFGEQSFRGLEQRSNPICCHFQFAEFCLARLVLDPAYAECDHAGIFHNHADPGAELDDELVGVVHTRHLAMTAPRSPDTALSLILQISLDFAGTPSIGHGRDARRLRACAASTGMIGGALGGGSSMALLR